MVTARRQVKNMNTSTESTPPFPLAPHELEARAREIFPVDMSPEEFAGRDGEGWEAFPFAHYQYRDADLNAWIQRFAEILATPGMVEVYQMKYLTPQERARIMALKGLIEDDL